MRSNSSIIFDKLLSEIEINRVKDKFKKDSQDVLEDAIKKHRNINSGGIPFWMYAILAYFAYDDIFRMCMNPILFYPIMFIISILALLYSIGLGPIMMPLAMQHFNMILRRIGVPFQF